MCFPPTHSSVLSSGEIGRGLSETFSHVIFLGPGSSPSYLTFGSVSPSYKSLPLSKSIDWVPNHCPDTWQSREGSGKADVLQLNSPHINYRLLHHPLLFSRAAPLHFSLLISPLLFSVQGLFLLTLTDWLIHWLLYWLTDSLPLVCATQLIVHPAPPRWKMYTHTDINPAKLNSVWYINISAFKKKHSWYKYMCRLIKMQKSRFLLISLPLSFTCNF